GRRTSRTARCAALGHLVAPDRPLAGAVSRASGARRARALGGGLVRLDTGAAAAGADRAAGRSRLLVLRRGARRRRRRRRGPRAPGPHFNPEIMIDLTRKRWKIRNMIRVGSATTTAAAAMLCHCEPYCPCIEDRPCWTIHRF